MTLAVELIKSVASLAYIETAVDRLYASDSIEETVVGSLEGDDAGVLEDLGGLRNRHGGVDIDVDNGDNGETAVGSGGMRGAGGGEKGDEN